MQGPGTGLLRLGLLLCSLHLAAPAWFSAQAFPANVSVLHNIGHQPVFASACTELGQETIAD